MLLMESSCYFGELVLNAFMESLGSAIYNYVFQQLQTVFRSVRKIAFARLFHHKAL